MSYFQKNNKKAQNKFIDLISLSCLTCGITFVSSNSILAKPITYDFTINVVEGSLKGRSFKGFFSYDDQKLADKETNIIGVEDGLNVCLNFFEQNYDHTKDVDYPLFPQLTLKQGQPESLDFWIEKSSRQLWWNQNGWQVEISLRPENDVVDTCQISS